MPVKSRPRVLDLFCGAGGLSWGFKHAGFDVRWGLDNWLPAVNTFSANHPEAEVHHVDITQVPDKELEDKVWRSRFLFLRGRELMQENWSNLCDLEKYWGIVGPILGDE